MKNPYQNNLINFFLSLQVDLKNKKIDEEQFNFLLGVLLKKELNFFVNKGIEEILPKPNETTNQAMTLITYKKNRTLNYAP